jgi:hypothetical protein
MQQIIDKLKIAFMGKSMPEYFVNMSIDIRRKHDDAVEQRAAVAHYLYSVLSTELSDAERDTFVNSIMQLDSAIVSLELE